MFCDKDENVPFYGSFGDGGDNGRTDSDAFMDVDGKSKTLKRTKGGVSIGSVETKK